MPFSRKLKPLGALMLLLTASCTCLPPTGSTSPLSPISPLPPPSDEDSLVPRNWASTTVGDAGISAYYVEIQIYEPLAWTDVDWDGENIWLANNLMHELVALNRAGKTARTIPYPTVDAVPLNITGVAATGERIWLVDVAHKRLYALDQKTGEIVDEHEITDTASGLDWDGTNLWIAKGELGRIEKRNEEYDLLADYTTTSEWITGIAWDGQRVWYADRYKAWSLDPVSGQFMEQPTISPMVGQLSFNGISWAGDYLLFFNDMGGRLYAIPREE
jgi:outer membrane protein assembly factor BamB